MMLILLQKSYCVFWSHKTYISGIIILFLILVSCKSVPFSSASDERDFDQHLYKTVLAEGSKSYSADIELVIKTDDVQKLRGKVFIKRGEFIFASVNFLGIELARVEISNDSIKFINRYEKTYFFGKINSFRSVINFDLDYFQLESLILKGLIFDLNDNKRSFKSRISKNEDGFIYLYDRMFEFKSLYNEESFEMIGIKIKDVRSAIMVNVTTKNFFNEINYPENINVKVSGNSINIEADIVVGKISKERIESGNFLINNKYRELKF